jgi:phenylpropionate dioxygenase-like ring-hydroxylating dioxygenase large terminal subunit
MKTTTLKESKVPEIARGVPLGLELGLRNYWYPVLQTEELAAEKPSGFRVLNENFVAWRDGAGKPRVLRDKCPHRGAKLSAGRVLEGDLQCAWHGLRFDGGGRCTLIPWEEGSKHQDEVSIDAYPAEELGGYVWAYIGDTKKFPPPPLADCVPEELSHPESFIWFRMPTEIWNANWLQCLEGSDGFHAVMLHSDSQAVSNEAWTGGRPKSVSVPIAQRRMKILQTPQGFRGVALDLEGNAIHHGHFLEGWKGERWTLPGTHSIPLRPVPNADPYVSRLFQFPIDATRTQTVRFLSWRATTDEERAQRTRLWNDVVYRRQIEVAGEDRVIVETLGDLADSRSEEFLFYPDQDVVRVRRKLAEAFLAQREGKRAVAGRDAMIFPV